MSTNAQKAARPFVSRVRVQGFRSVAECDVRLGPLTVLAGFNAAGKSNFLDAIRFVRDALALSPTRAIAQRGGLDSILWRGRESAGEGVDSFSITLELSFAGGDATYHVRVGRAPGLGFPLAVLGETLILAVGDERAEYAVGLVDDRERRVGDVAPGVRLGPDELLLPLLGRYAPYDILLQALLGMRFHELDTPQLRGLDDTRVRQVRLGERGEHLGQVLRALSDGYPEVKDSVDGWMRWLIPSLLGVDHRMQGDYVTIQARFWTGDPNLPFWEAVNAGRVNAGDPHVEVFESEQLSEGTIRAIGVLAALNQPDALDGTIPLVALEEPELAIHPAKVSGVLSAMAEAANHTQVIATTQSSDLLNGEETESSTLRIVEMDAGVSRIGSLSGHMQDVLRKNPDQLPEFHRQGWLRPVGDSEGESGA
ncbi:AAA family ATPase [Rhizohabitans arisaemae]|uniref:AAA family ATPase n=1 Tax=Rhizohabitans arisaemae TaxID=2720610 RepID=UPI0024B1C548|nr:AAA family ATPase [Rhizohabitans arisaemae]